MKQNHNRLISAQKEVVKTSAFDKYILAESDPLKLGKAPKYGKHYTFGILNTHD